MGVLKQQKEILSGLFYIDFKQIFWGRGEEKKSDTNKVTVVFWWSEHLSVKCPDVKKSIKSKVAEGFRLSLCSLKYDGLIMMQWKVIHVGYSGVRRPPRWFWLSHLKAGKPLILLIKVSVTAAVKRSKSWRGNNIAYVKQIQCSLKITLQSQGEFASECVNPHLAHDSDLTRAWLESICRHYHLYNCPHNIHPW